MTTIELLIAIFGCAGFWTFVTELIKNRRSKEQKEKETRDLIKVVMDEYAAETIKKALEPVEASTLALSKDRLLHLCNKYLSDGTITAAQMDALNSLYKGYTLLGGNGTIKKLYEQVQEIDIEVE